MNWKLKRYTQLKRGDKIKCIINPNSRGSDETHNYGRGAGWKLDKIFTIKNIDTDSMINIHNGQRIIWVDETECGIFEDEVEKVTE